MENGENGEWRMENGEWRMENGDRETIVNRMEIVVWGERRKWINDAIVIPFLGRMLYGDGVERSV